MGCARAVTANEGVQGIDAMHQTGFAQKLQRSVNRGWLHGARIAFGESLQQIVSTDRPVAGPYQFQHTTP
jgi:hypothetical protein